MTNINNNTLLGYILSISEDSCFIARMGTRVWPVHIYDPAGSFAKPYPEYKGSAKIEGTAKGDSLVHFWVDKSGFQPCVLNLQGVRMKDVDGNIATFTPPEGVKVAALVRYTERGRPELRIITEPAHDELTERYGWTRRPIRAKGEDDAERHKFVRDLVKGTRRDDEPEFVQPTTMSQPAEVYLEDDPFAC